MCSDTGWRRPIGCLKLQVIFRKRATNSRALMLKMTYQDMASYESSPPCTTICRSKHIHVWHVCRYVSTNNIPRHVNLRWCRARGRVYCWICRSKHIYMCVDTSTLYMSWYVISVHVSVVVYYWCPYIYVCRYVNANILLVSIHICV